MGHSKDSIPRQAFDATIQAETGFMEISGQEKEPTMIGTVLLDYTTGLNTAVGILAALNKKKYNRQRYAYRNFINIICFIIINGSSTGFFFK